ncbi:MAG: valine--tRNA ligase [Planctomycetaceae bacterium]|jgi:valyl-tRNA synthetase|nr:valine--tRNA ligase [Planctomycetaceae bacterium]
MATEIPKQYDPAAAQSKWAVYWDEQGVFASSPNANKKPYTIVIPPPNVTGALHLGHALDDTLQDILIRHKRMAGFETLWVPGVDHAGIATQAVVERRLFEEEKKTRHDIGRDALVKRIWDWKEQYQERIIRQLKNIGCSCDWSRTRFTLDPQCAKAVRHFFYKLFAENLVYRGKRLVNWDTFLQTAVSDDEVFHAAVQGSFWYIKYPVVNPKPNEPTHVIVATTRPETMLGDTAVAVHPEPRKALDNIEKELFAELEKASPKDRDGIELELNALRQRRTEMLPQLEQLAAMARDRRTLSLPLTSREIPLLCDEWAKPEKGTGCVKITPAHDPNDYEVGLRQKLEMINIMNKDGTLNDNGGAYTGLTMQAARKRIVDDLDTAGLLAKVEEREIELAHSDRSKTAIEPFLNDQWFVRMTQLAQNAIDAVNPAAAAQPGEKTDKINIFPPRYTKGYVDWLSEKRDWPIGRQLWWGHRIPIWYCKDASEAELKTAFANRTDVTWRWDDEQQQWWICSEEDDLAADAVKGHKIVQEEDVLDTWFSSALWPLSTLGWPNETPDLQYYYPTSVLVTSRDIITLWVARMVIAGLFNKGVKPFSEVFIHPKILDKYGEGMSKSKGNGVDPLSVVLKYGADALRFSLAFLTTENQDVRLPVDFECPHCQAVIELTKKNRTLPSMECPKCKKKFRTQLAEKPDDKALPEAAVVGERFEVARNFCNKLWNASRFVLMSLGETDEQYDDGIRDTSTLLLEDKWILSRLATVTQQVTDGINSYRFSEVARAIYDFAWDDYCSFYVEMVKYRLGNAELRTTAERVLLFVLDNILRLLHPITPFLTEEVWHRLGEVRPKRGLREQVAASECIALAAWPIADKNAVDVEIEQRFAVFQQVLRAVREIRASRNVPPKTDINFAVKCDDVTKKLLEPMSPYFRSMAGANAAGFGQDVAVPTLASMLPLDGMEVIVDLSGLIDVDAERNKKEKEIAKLAELVKAKESKLTGSFIEKAPASVVEAERKSLESLKEQLSVSRVALEQLINTGNC